jgi:sulfatase modifying factor 1
MKTTTAIAFVLLALCCASTVSAVTIDMVTVGNPGNAPDTRYNSIAVGSVGYTYEIGKYEVTAGQYTEFLNAVAKADPNGLYNTNMEDPVNQFGANILRAGSSPNFNYSVAADWADRPVNYVTFWDAARFANWLHNGQPTGAQGPGTTEGGAYHDVGDQTLFGRSAGARFFIPTEDEWYKAAYHDKTAGLAASYFDYPTGTNVVPGNDINETTNPGNNVNYFISNYAIGSPYYRTVAGEFELSDSLYGTFDQGGNVWEWNETKIGSSRYLRGGSRSNDSSALQSSFRIDYFSPALDSQLVGFRMASSAVPEPNTLLLGVLGSFGMLVRRGRKRTSHSFSISLPHSRPQEMCEFEYVPSVPS